MLPPGFTAEVECWSTGVAHDEEPTEFKFLGEHLAGVESLCGTLKKVPLRVTGGLPCP